ncbi:MAG: RNA 2',3'-cyclic phosphodiesterase [Syntrophomonadaceae bacterium]|jgi:2'-5' RNA ligase|nr:RNA 2',3'-cyclic phosphodiesterase [Syntrophomonadaceae bacterium]
MRVFIAIPIENVLKDNIAKITKNIMNTSVKIKWVEYENYHLTLKFLGDVSVSQTEKVMKNLKNVSQNCPPYEMILQNLGFFPNNKKPKVVWMGIKEGIPRIRRHSELVDNAVAPLGFEKERRPVFHLTLGRIRSDITDGEYIARVEELGKNMEPVKLNVDRFDLMESRLTSKGPIYTILEEYKMDGN